MFTVWNVALYPTMVLTVMFVMFILAIDETFAKKVFTEIDLVVIPSGPQDKQVSRVLLVVVVCFAFLIHSSSSELEEITYPDMTSSLFTHIFLFF